MADFAAAGGKNIRAAQMSSTPSANLYYFATLHDASGSALTSASTTYAASGIGELATANGYTAGGKACGTMTATGAAIDCPDVAWTTGTGETLTASYCAVWVNTTNSITGAQCLAVKDSAATPATASNGGALTQPIANLLTMT